jgi:hypothetical protein
MSDDVDPDEPRPDGHYHIDKDADWFYVNDKLAPTVALGPATDGEPGDDWVLAGAILGVVDVALLWDMTTEW